MRILVHGINYAPELTGIGKYTGEMAEWLAARGHEVRVVTAPPYYPAWKVSEGYRGWWYQPEHRQGVRVWRCPLWVPARPTGLKRIFHLASFALSSLPVMLGQALWRPDVVFVVEPPLFCTPSAWLTARLCGAQCWLHVQDFEVDAAFELGLLPRGPMRQWVLGMEWWLLGRFDRVSSISGRMLDRLSAKGVEGKRRFFFPNWVDTEAIHPLTRSSIYRKELGIPESAVVALYSGNMGEKQGLEMVVEAAQALQQEPGLRFVMCGQGAAHDRLWAQAAGLPNMFWIPLQPVERLNELLNLADIHLLPQRAGAADLVMPSKLGGMLASGRPVVAAAGLETELGRAVEGRGILVPPGDVQAFVEAVRRLAGDPALRRTHGDAGREFAVRMLARERILERLEQALSGGATAGSE